MIVFTMMKRRISLALLLLTCVLSIQAQKVEGGDKKVKRIQFDCEQVTIVYDDDTKDAAVQQAVIVKDETTAVKSAEKVSQPSERRWYAVDGRTMSSEPRGTQRGIYVVRERDAVRKIIKK
jgi:hypothetical protein